MKKENIESTREFPVDRVNMYIERVVRDAFTAEDRLGGFRYQYGVLDNYIYMRTWCNWYKVERRVLYRLARNFDKNFHYKFFVERHILDSNIGTRAINDRYIDINHTIDFITLLGKPNAITVYSTEHPLGKYLNPDAPASDEAMHSIICSKLCDLYGEYHPYEGESGWEQYCKDYAKLYGSEPPAKGKTKVYPQVEITIES